ncbi:MAG: hypothetical protein H6733_05350 [Alphaproteobacteria bacterium]|nr:hypothetical protein [Alphaproteobacteria bacterium]
MRARSFLMLTAVGLATGCGATVRQAFQARLDATLSAPPPLTDRWAPDATLYLSPALLQDGVSTALDGLDVGAALSLPGVSATPRLHVERVVLRAPSAPCGVCLGVDGQLRGTLEIAAFGLATRTGLSASLGLDVGVRTAAADDGWTVLLAPERLTDLDLRLDDAGMGSLGTGRVRTGMTEALLDRLPPLPALHVGGDALPLRDVRVQAAPSGLRVDVRTRAPGDATAVPAPVVDQGWSARVATGSVLALVRADLFRQGPVQHGVWVDPTSLQVEGDRFTLGLRLWRPKGGAWWRDLTVTGSVRLQRATLDLVAEDVAVVQTSPGARFADPIVAMAETRVLASLAQATLLSLPVRQTQGTGDGRATWRVTALHSEGDTLVATGTARFGARAAR